MEDHFYVVIASDDSRLHRHFDSELATNEAKRLATANPTKKFFICHAERVAKVTAPVAVEETNRDPVPF